MSNLFKGIEKDRSNANIDNITQNTYFYALGYKRAAEILCCGIEKKSVQERDSLVYPIVFLYRQFIELSLKDIIKDLDNKLNNQEKRKCLDEHKLLPLWDLAVKLFDDFVEVRKAESFTSIERNKERNVINEFDKTDHFSFSFRYLTDKKGQKLLSTLDYISINHFKEEVDVVADYIAGMVGTLCYIEDFSA